MKKLFVIFVLLFFLSFIGYSGDMEIGVHAGISGGDFDSGLAFGIDFSKKISKDLMLDADFTFYPSPTEEAEYQDIYGSGSVSTSAWNLNVSALYLINLENSDFIPYITGGIGLFNFNVSADVSSTYFSFGLSESSTDFNIGVGGGFKYYLNEKTGIRAEVKYFNVFAGDNYGVFRITGGAFISLD